MRQELKFYGIPIRDNIIDLYGTIPTCISPIVVGDFTIVDVPEEGIVIAQAENEDDIRYLNELGAEKIGITSNPDHNLHMFEEEFLAEYVQTEGKIRGFIETTFVEDIVSVYVNPNGTISVSTEEIPLSIDDIIDNPNIIIVSAEEFMSEGSMDLDEASDERILSFEEIVWGIRMNQLTLEDAVEALKKLQDIQLN